MIAYSHNEVLLFLIDNLFLVLGNFIRLIKLDKK